MRSGLPCLLHCEGPEAAPCSHPTPNPRARGFPGSTLGLSPLQGISYDVRPGVPPRALRLGGVEEGSVRES